MTCYFDFARTILSGQMLSDKYLDTPIEWGDFQTFSLPVRPGRSSKLAFSEERLKFPKPNRLNENDKKAIALHSFANHELLAIEMMAAAILIYPHQSEESVRFKRGIVSALKDEQKHLKLYIGRLNELGYDFGDFPLNDFFWKQMEKLKTPAAYAAVMSMTFEAANLDFALYYSKIFRSQGDDKTAAILDTVLEDEISHVAFGSHWLKRWKNEEDLWSFYLKSLPKPLTPARSKGIEFSAEAHGQAVMDDVFLEHLINYQDDFPVTKRSRA